MILEVLGRVGALGWRYYLLLLGRSDGGRRNPDQDTSGGFHIEETVILRRHFIFVFRMESLQMLSEVFSV